MKLKKFLIFILISLSCIGGHTITRAQDTPEPKPIWTEEQWQQAKDGIDYAEEEKKNEKEKSTQTDETEQVKNSQPPSDFRMSEWLTNFFSSPIIKIITIFIIVVLLTLTILFLMKSGRNKDSKITAQLTSDLDNPKENIEETDLDRFLRLSLEAGDYNTAIRVLYLTSLQSLHIGKWLMWQKDKTNQDYLTEMRSQNNYGDFRELTYIYEVIWYGDQRLTHGEFEQLKLLFDKFLDTIKIGSK